MHGHWTASEGKPAKCQIGRELMVTSSSPFIFKYDRKSALRFSKSLAGLSLGYYTLADQSERYVEDRFDCSNAISLKSHSSSTSPFASITAMADQADTPRDTPRVTETDLKVEYP